MVLGKRLLGKMGGGGAGSPSAYGGVRASPMKGRKSPFKRRISSLTKGSSAGAAEGGGAGAAANIRVAVRVRPENQTEQAGAYRNVINVVDDQMLVFDPKEEEDGFYFQGKKQNQRRDLNKAVAKDHTFTFDVVLGPTATNEEVFRSTTKDLVDVLFGGYNCSVFVYGATGAGKTHTMLGSPDNPGITFKTVMELYQRIEEKKEECSCEVAVSYLEVYNETIVDLINHQSGQLAIREDGKNAVNIPGLSIHRPSGPDDLLRLLQYGNSNRQQHPTDANHESSRSHAVFQVMLKQKARNQGLSGSVKVAKLSMIDLAGSEKGSATSSREKARVREGANINKSLLALGNCINALAEGSKYVPYRNSKLTRLLKDSIGGNCRTVMISNVSPSSMSFEDTYNTLKYADRAKKIKVNLKKNVMSVNFHVGQYAKIVEDLKSEINILQRKVRCLEQDNDELREKCDKASKQQQKPAVDVEELAKLKAELATLQERQSDYDNLQSRLKEFEERAVKAEAAAASAAVTASAAADASLTTSDSAPLGAAAAASSSAEGKAFAMDDYGFTNEEYGEAFLAALYSMERLANETSSLKMLDLNKQIYQSMVQRAEVFGITSGGGGSAASVTSSNSVTSSTTMRRLRDYLSKVERKIDKCRKRILRVKRKKESACQFVSDILDTWTQDASGNSGQSGSQIQSLKFSSHCQIRQEQLEKEHLLKVVKELDLHKKRTEEVLLESLRQLKKSHLLLRIHGHATEEAVGDFQSLASKVQCSNINWRDELLVETNLDEPEDHVKGPLSRVISLDSLNSSPTQQHLSTSSVSPSVAAAANVDEQDEEGDDDEEEEEERETVVLIDKEVADITGSGVVEQDEEETNTAPWRPPTPPKSSPSATAQAPPPPSAAVEEQNLPVSLSSKFDETFDVNAAANLTFEMPTASGAADDSTFEMPASAAADRTFEMPASAAADRTFEMPASSAAADRTFEMPESAPASVVNMTFDMPAAASSAFEMPRPPPTPSKAFEMPSYAAAAAAGSASSLTDRTFDLGEGGGAAVAESPVVVRRLMPSPAVDTTVVLDRPVFSGTSAAPSVGDTTVVLDQPMFGARNLPSAAAALAPTSANILPDILSNSLTSVSGGGAPPSSSVPSSTMAPTKTTTSSLRSQRPFAGRQQKSGLEIAAGKQPQRQVPHFMQATTASSRRLGGGGLMTSSVSSLLARPVGGGLLGGAGGVGSGVSALQLPTGGPHRPARTPSPTERRAAAATANGFNAGLSSRSNPVLGAAGKLPRSTRTPSPNSHARAAAAAAVENDYPTSNALSTKASISGGGKTLTGKTVASKNGKSEVKFMRKAQSSSALRQFNK